MSEEIKPSLRDRLANWVKPDDTDATPPAVTTKAAKASTGIGSIGPWLRAQNGSTDGVERQVTHPTDAQRSFAGLLSRISPRGPRG